MRVAIVHDWLTVYAGAEKVLEQMLNIWPDADLFSVVDFLQAKDRHFVKGKRASTTFLQGFPKAATRYRSYLALMPLAIEQLDLSGYDVVVSSCHAVSKGVITGPDQLHVCYVHSPIRYAWDLQHQYLAESRMNKGLKGWVARAVLHYIRIWDVRTANGVDRFVSNSQFIARRVAKVYRRSAAVVYPPVDIDAFSLVPDKEHFYLTASRLVPYKRIPLIIEAFSRMPDKTLIVIGDGPEFDKAQALATSNVRLLGYQPFDVLRDHMQRARAFVFAAEEDFGITPVEAQACGTPVIAFARGGALETIRGHSGVCSPTGVFFFEQSAEAIVGAVLEFEADPSAFKPWACRRNAERFSVPRFLDEFRSLVESAWGELRAGSGTISSSAAD